MHRLFVAIRPPEAIRDLLIDAMDEGPGLSWVGEDNLHLTLRFIGEVERRQAEEIVTALEQISSESFQLEVAGAGRFDRRSGGALWAGVRPRRPVAELAKKIDRACMLAGLEPEHRAFHPHITLARYRSANAAAARDFERRLANLSSEPFDVSSFMLFESHLSRHGAHYEVVEVLPLR
jgi:2'-5' RNA ligase